MRALDRRAMDWFGLPGAVLMENAGRAVAAAVMDFSRGPVTVFCGPGNNGGDGLVAARWLAKAGRRVSVVLALPPERWRGEAASFWLSVRRGAIPWRVYADPLKLVKFTAGAGLFIDALLGTGARRPIVSPFADLIAFLNSGDVPVLSVDVPSGLNADTGASLGACVRARWTVTMGRPKKGLLSKRAGPFVGRLTVADIGFPAGL